MIASESQWSPTVLSPIETHAWLCCFGFTPVDQLYSCISCLAIVIFSCSTKDIFKTLGRGECGKWSNKTFCLLIRQCPCSTIHGTDRKTWLVLCWMCNYPSIFWKLPYTYWLQYDLQSREVLWCFQLYRWSSGIRAGLEHMLNLCDVNLINLTYSFLSKSGVKYSQLAHSWLMWSREYPQMEVSLMCKMDWTVSSC